MQSKIDWCDIVYQPIVNDDDVVGVYSYKHNLDKTMIAYRSGGFELVYDGTPVFTTDICELGFSWLQSKYVGFNEFILDAVMVNGGQ
jgi:hypothetical protein